MKNWQLPLICIKRMIDTFLAEAFKREYSRRPALILLSVHESISSEAITAKSVLK